MGFACSVGCNFDLAVPGATGGAGGGSASIGGTGGVVEGGRPSVGGGGSGGDPVDDCSCGLEDGWVPVAHTGNVIAGGPDRTLCEDRQPPLKLYFGEQEVECAPCECQALGCAPQPLRCYASTDCTGSNTLIQPSTSCMAVGGNGCRSVEEDGPTSPAFCSTTGGAPSASPYEYQAGFCATSECGDGCYDPSTSCVVRSGFEQECPGQLAYRYELWASAQATCQPCDCSATCVGPDYQAGVLTCGENTVDTQGCINFSFPTHYFQRRKQPSCEVSPEDAKPAMVEVGDGYTVCCAAPLAALETSID